MPEKKTIKRARKLKREGKSPSTQAGEFVREEIHHVREGKHGARSPEQAIAIGLSKARRAGVKLPPPKKGKSTTAVRRSAVSALRKGRSRKEPSAARSRATLRALRHESRGTASASSLSRHARSAARKRGPRDLSDAAKKAARTRARHTIPEQIGVIVRDGKMRLDFPGASPSTLQREVRSATQHSSPVNSKQPGCSGKDQEKA